MPVIEVGDRVRIINGGVYLGKWLPSGTEGKVIGGVISLKQYLYRVEIDGEVYSLAPAEFEVIFRSGQTTVIDDDGEID